ncbi:MAG: hypothetical protein JNM27_19485 [Leptospirales bacterium]|nr:hypothetical protein [Leptospirales bacterium]
MKHWIWKTLAGWLVLWLFVLPAVLLPLAFLAQKLGDAYLSEAGPQAKTQAVELVRLLASQAEGELTPEKLVNMSQAMSDLVQRSNTSYTDIMVIKDLALIDPKGKVLAHFDVTQIAKDTTSAYKTKEVLGLFNRLRRNSVDTEISGLYTPELSKDPVTQALVARYMPTIRARYPDLLAGQYTVTSSVYPVDGEVPKAGFVLTIEHRSPARVLHVISSVFVPVMLFALGVIVIVGFFYLPVLVLITARKQEAKAVKIAEYENSHVDEDDLPDISAEPDFESVSPTDFDDVPLPDFLEDAPIPGPTVSTEPLYAPPEQTSGPVRVQPVPSREVPVPSMAVTAARYAHSEILDAIPLEADN